MKTFDPVSNELSIGTKWRTEPEGRPALSRLVSLIFRAGERSESLESEITEVAVPVLERIERELQTITDRAEAALKDSVSGAAAGAPFGSPARPHRPDPKELLREEGQVAQRAMEQDIVRLHRQLKTGIMPDRMEQLARVLAAHAPLSTNFPVTRFQDRIEMGVLRHLYLRAGEAAWGHLGDLLARSGLAWPPPDGLPLRISIEELQRRREAHNGAIRRDFMLAPASQVASLIHGTIDVWRYAYPARSSYLWLQTALRAVAAALRAEAFAAAVEIWLWRSADLEKEILECVSAKLSDAWTILEREAHTMTDGAEVVARVDEICGASIPQIVWNHAVKNLGGTWHPWPEQGINSKEETRVDPMCGMTLPAPGDGEHLERDGETFYFCTGPGAVADRATIGIERKEHELETNLFSVADPCACFGRLLYGLCSEGG
jgi:hypothetical protein